MIAQGKCSCLAAAIAVIALCAAAPAIGSAKLVIGSKEYAAPIGQGWGAAEPRELFNGGDPAGDLEHIHWQSWGGPTAIGWGRTWTFKPQGGYYNRPVRVELRAASIGECAGHRAYRHLSVRHPNRPGGKLGPWRSWGPGRSLCERY
jgi:hypothetical protein